MITYSNFVYDNKNLEEVNSHNTSRSTFITSITRTMALGKGLMEGEMIVVVFRTIVIQHIYSSGKKISSSLILFPLLLSYMDAKLWVAIPLENCGVKLSKSISIL